MSTVTLTGKNFEEYVEKPGILVIDWWATWCGPCRAFAPIYEKASDKYPDVVFGKIDTDAEPELAGSFQIQSIPTLMIFREQVLVFARPGMLPGPALDELLEKVKGLDMDAVRRQVADDEAAHASEDDHAGHDHAGHDHAGHDHAGHDHDHAGHDHAGHDHDHAGHGHDAPAPDKT